MKIREVMVRSVETIGPAAPIRDAAIKMQNSNVGMLPVIDGGHVVGIVTDRDLVVRGLVNKEDNVKVRDTMTPNPICLLPDADVEVAVASMRENRVGRLLITDEVGHLEGVLTAADVAVAYAGDKRVGQLATTLSTFHRKPTAISS